MRRSTASEESRVSSIDEQEIQEVIKRVRSRLDAAGSGAGVQAQTELAEIQDLELGDGIFPTIDEAVAAATRAFHEYQRIGLGGRYAVVDAIRAAMLEQAERLAHMAHQETGLGRPDDKVIKNRLVTTKAPGPEDLEPMAVTGDAGMMVTEWAPFGVVGAITPTTNPTSTIINNTISVISAGNACVFNVHPSAKKVSAENIRLLNRAIVGAGLSHAVGHRSSPVCRAMCRQLRLWVSRRGRYNPKMRGEKKGRSPIGLRPSLPPRETTTPFHALASVPRPWREHRRAAARRRRRCRP